MSVDISGAGAFPRPVKVSGALVRLGVAGLCVFGALGGAFAFAGVLIDRLEPFGSYAPYGGWQVDATAAAFGAMLLTLLLFSDRALRRRYRDLRPQTRHGRAVIMAVVLPGLYLGGFAGYPVHSAISWASKQTSDAHRAIADYRKAPPILPLGIGDPASPALAARVLQPSDLGAGWYDGERPNPSVVSGGLQGQPLSVRSTLSQWHWTGAMWSPGNLLLESLRRFATPATAQAYLAKFGEQPKGVPGPRLGPVTHVRVGTVLVYEDQEVGSIRLRGAAFVVGADEFSVTSSNVPAADFATLVKAAVDKATTGR